MITVLVPSLGILLFNFYLETVESLASVLVPSLGILLFNIKFEKDCFIVEKFSSPLWGFFYLILLGFISKGNFSVLVPSLGILLFNFSITTQPQRGQTVLVPSLGILLFNKLCRKLQLQKQRSRPLSGDSFI